MKGKRRAPEIHLDYMFLSDEKEGNRWHFLVPEESGESCAKHGGSEKVDGSMDMSNSDGVAS